MKLFSKKPLSKEELVERLKAIASDETPRVEKEGAMCYCPAPAIYKHIDCDLCGSDILYRVFMGDSHRTIKKLVRSMAGLGYDVKLQTVCNSCAEKLKEELYPNLTKEGNKVYNWQNDIRLKDINHVFFFRTSADAEYHRAIANETYQYTALLTLLQNEPMYSGHREESHYIADEINALEYMTGIKFNV